MLGIPKGTSPNYWFYSLLVEEKAYGMGRDKLMHYLVKKGIQVRPIWYLNHLQRPYRRNQAYKIENAFRFLSSVLNLPSSVGLRKTQINYITSVIRSLSGGN